MLIIENISKHFNAGRGKQVRAVESVSFEVKPGELLAIVGPSGSGKTTLLRLLAGLEEPTAGQVIFGGKPVLDLPPHQREISMVFQDHALYPHMTVRENLAFGLKLRHVKEPELGTRVTEVARWLGLQTLLDRIPDALSGGERQRVALGRALVSRPRVVLLDEPFSNLDAPLRGQMRRELVRLQREIGFTGVYVTHDQLDAMSIGHRLAVIHRGELQQIGKPQELYRNPANIFVAGFLGLPPMNLWPGRFEKRQAGMLFRGTPPATLELPCAPAVSELLEPVSGREIVVGIRPEKLRLQKSLTDLEPDLAVVRGTVDLIEALGWETHLTVNCAGTTCTVRLTGEVDLAPGELVWAAFDWRQVHLFDRGTGARVI
jgi:multiple sugar transport system ATP-binding protein